MASRRSVAGVPAGGLVAALASIVPTGSATAAPGDATVTVQVVALRAQSSFDTLDAADFYPEVTIAGQVFGGHDLGRTR